MLTPDKVAKLLQVSKKTVLHLNIPCIKLGRLRRYVREDVLAYLRAKGQVKGQEELSDALHRFIALCQGRGVGSRTLQGQSPQGAAFEEAAQELENVLLSHEYEQDELGQARRAARLTEGLDRRFSPTTQCSRKSNVQRRSG